MASTHRERVDDVRGATMAITSRRRRVDLPVRSWAVRGHPRVGSVSELASEPMNTAAPRMRPTSVSEADE
jgi:hypothetical protein